MNPPLNRRDLARLLGLSAAATTLPAAAITPAPAETTAPLRFPPDFLWGTATSAYQIEGAPDADGRGLSIWDTFSRAKRSYSGDNGDVADDEYHRYPEDIALMRTLGCQTYQLSLSWSRIFPTGKAPANPAGWAYYDRVIDLLLASGIQPFVNLYHWDLPEALSTAGGWQSRDTAEIFADFAAATALHLGDRVHHFIPISEITAFIDAGYRFGSDAPGLKLDTQPLAQVNHNVLLAHGLATQALRAHAPRPIRVGIADNCVSTCPVIVNPENIAAARRAFREENGRSLTPILEGRYPETYLHALGADGPRFTPEDMRIISTPLDFVGLNIYEPTWVRATTDPLGYEFVDMPKSYPKMAAGWLQLGPEGMYWSLKHLQSLWNPAQIFITENGVASLDVPTKSGEILDVDRVFFLRSYLAQLHRALAEGVPVKGYFLWSLIDNFEWSDGYAMRFGIVYVDYKTQKRTPKLSFDFYRQLLATHTLP